MQKQVQLKRVHILIPEDLLARVDTVAGYQGRGEYVRQALIEKVDQDLPRAVVPLKPARAKRQAQ